jgi:hypothetical protein
MGAPDLHATSDATGRAQLHGLRRLVEAYANANNPAPLHMSALSTSRPRPGADARRQLPQMIDVHSHKRRPYHHPFALHQPDAELQLLFKQLQTGITRSAADKNHRLRPTGQIGVL